MNRPATTASPPEPPRTTDPPAPAAIHMKGQARTQFEKWAGSYDRSLLNHFLFRPSYMMLGEEIARWHAEHDRPFRVLDVGCGTGTLAAVMAHSPWPVTAIGLDYSHNMCRMAHAKIADARLADRAAFVNADSEHLPFADASFDIITCANSFHHYPHQQAVIVEMRRLLAPGGRLMVIDGFRDCVIGWVIYDVIINRIEKKVHHAPWNVMQGFLKEAGFQNIRSRKFNFFLPAFVTLGDVQSE